MFVLDIKTEKEDIFIFEIIIENKMQRKKGSIDIALVMTWMVSYPTIYNYY